MKESASWKLKYYLGLIYWNRGLKDKAIDLFEKCGDSPDFAAFYLSKAELVNDNESKERVLIKAFELDKNDWRPAISLVEYYLSMKEAEKALPIVKAFLEKFPEQSNIGLAYARTLMQMQSYEESVAFLEKYNVLPFEGATAGRDLYHEACIKLAEKCLDNKEYKKALLYAEKALKWPANLGVGRPYDVDESQEKRLILKAKEGLKQ
jgi:tetratricopeptide (TPR) repeat protein